MPPPAPGIWLDQFFQGSPGPIGASVTTIAELAVLDTTAFILGAQAYVQSTKRTYFLDRTSTATPDGSLFIAALGGGNWVQLPGVLGRAFVGGASAQEDIADFVGTVIPGDGALHTIASLSQPIALDEIVTLATTVTMRRPAGTPGAIVIRRIIAVQNNGGTVTALDGTTSDQSVSTFGVPGVAGAPSGAAAQITISGTSLLVQAKATQPFFARCALSVDRALYPGSSTLPSVTAIAPSYGASNVTTAVSITVVNPSGITAAGVQVGATKYPLTGFSIVGTTITGTLPTAVVGKGAVYITTGVTDYLSSVPFWYLSAAGPSSDVAIVPTSGAASGATGIAISATSGLVGLDIPGFGVTFGGTPATSVTITSDAAASCVTPGGPAGAVSCVIATPTGSRTLTYTYVNTGPTIVSVSQNTSRGEGGIALTIVGSGVAFTGATSVKLCGIPQTFTVTDATHIAIASVADCGATAGLGVGDVQVTVPAGTSAPGNHLFCYLPKGVFTWHRADLGMTTSAGNVATWADQASLAWAYGSIGTAAVNASDVGGQPSVTELAGVGYPYVSNTGAGQTYTGTGMSVMMVAKRPTLTGGAHLLSAVDFSNAAADTAQAGGFTIVDNATTLTLNRNGTTAVGTVTLGTTAPFVLTARFDGTNAVLRVNGADLATVASTGAFSANGMLFGNGWTGGGGVSPDGEVHTAEALAISRSLTTADLATLSAYTTWRYGVAA